MKDKISESKVKNTKKSEQYEKPVLVKYSRNRKILAVSGQSVLTK